MCARVVQSRDLKLLEEGHSQHEGSRPERRAMSADADRWLADKMTEVLYDKEA